MPTLESLISDEQIATLKLGFDNALCVKLAMASLSGPIPAAEPWVSGPGDYFFATDRNMGPTHRELCILSTLTALRCPDQLAIHVYWGLMVGLTVNQIGDAIYLGGDYGGIAAYNSAVKAAQITLQSLAVQAETGKADPTTLLAVTRVIPAVSVAYGRSIAGLPPA